jgi:hypothetical protein
MVQDLKMTSDGDLDCSELGLQLVDGAMRVSQQIRTRLRTFYGEWEFDLDRGVPWLQRILAIKGVNLNDVDAVLRAQILDVADVLDIITFSISLNTVTRTATIAARVSTTFGIAVVEGVFP